MKNRAAMSSRVLDAAPRLVLHLPVVQQGTRVRQARGAARLRLRRGLQTLIDAGLSSTRGRPLEGDGVGLRLLPWVAAGVLAFALLPLLPGGTTETANLIAGTLVPVIVVAALFAPWERLPAWMQAVPALIPFLMVALIRSVESSTESAYTPVVLLPVFWFALYGTRGQLLLSVVLVGVTLAVPSPAVGGDGYPVTEPGAALLWMTIAGIAGFTVSELVRQREALEVSLARIARTDALTGLPNRRAWDEELDRELARADRTSAPICAALLDLDHFKQFNDRNGHQAGDQHLRAATAAWRERLRVNDLIARYGGEEFVVLLNGTALAEATEVIEGLRTSVPRGESVSAGIAEWDRSESGTELVARADRALYEAKRNGRDRTIAAQDGALRETGG
jgi:diguanylate cyclase (GGDEF)-like protein